MNYYFDDFTQDNYERLIKIAKDRFQFIEYDSRNFQNKDDSRRILWRHDIDYSPHRALKLAKIEYRNQVKSTYFIQITSKYYNAFENEIRIDFSVTNSANGNVVNECFNTQDYSNSYELNSVKLGTQLGNCETQSEDYDIIENMDFFSDFEFIENMNGLEAS